jgi:hypothetical protein
MSAPTVEQMVRVLLEQAIDDGLVGSACSQWADPDPRARTAEELAGVAGILARYLGDAAAGGAMRRRRTRSSPTRPGATLDSRSDTR